MSTRRETSRAWTAESRWIASSAGESFLAESALAPFLALASSFEGIEIFFSEALWGFGLAAGLALREAACEESDAPARAMRLTVSKEERRRGVEGAIITSSVPGFRSFSG